MLRTVYIILYISVVLVIEEGVGDDRQGVAISGYTPDDVTAVLDTHNGLRRQTNSSNMRIMTWNTDLQGMAQGWVDTCEFGHNPDTKNRFGFSNVGENLFISQADTYVAEEAIEHWYEEIYDYVYYNLTCNPNRVCGHYTQVVWADSYEVGCGIKWCSHISNSFPGFEQGLLIVCNYGPAGNWPKAKPYAFGSACTECPTEAQVCVGGLCAISDSTTPSTTNTNSITSLLTSSTQTSTTDLSRDTASSLNTTSTTAVATRSGITTTTGSGITTITGSTTSTTSSSASSSPPTTTKTDLSSDSASSLNTKSTTAVATGSGITTITDTNSTEPKSELDFETEIIQTFVIFAFVAASVSVCFIFNTLRNRFTRKEEENPKLDSI